MKNIIKSSFSSSNGAVETGFSEKDITEQKKLSAKPPLKHNKKKRKALAAVSGLIVLIMVLTFALSRKAGTEKLSLAYEDTTLLSYTDFTNSISATGAVESADSILVYSTLSSVVKDIYVELGDSVEEGQLLAQLDDQRIKDQIDSQETSLEVAEAGRAQAVKTARDNYNQYKEALERDLNPNLNSAKAQVATTYENYTRALKTYERYRETLDADENTALLNQESLKINAKLALDMENDNYAQKQSEANEAYDNWRAAKDELDKLVAQRQSAWDEDQDADVTALEEDILRVQGEVETKRGIYDAALTKLEYAQKSLKNAEDSYGLAKAQYNAALTNAGNTLTDYADALESTKRIYEEALKNLKAARLAADNQLQSYANALQSAIVNADSSVAEVSLNQSRVELNSAAITAPVAGTVTAVYATVGSPGSGLLFVIEDVHNFIVETTIKEYDITSVTVGMPVTIKSNATGSDLYEGEVLSIAPTSIKTLQGMTDRSGDVEFAAKVKVTSPDTRLRIGMSVRLSYIVDQRANALSVPYDAVYTNQAQKQSILILEERSSESYLVKELTVTPELENDFAIVISGGDLLAGQRVINDPEEHKQLIGKEITLTNRPEPNITPFPWR